MSKTRKGFEETILEYIEKCNVCNFYVLMKWAGNKGKAYLKHIEMHSSFYMALLDGYRELNGLEPAYSDYIDD